MSKSRYHIGTLLPEAKAAYFDLLEAGLVNLSPIRGETRLDEIGKKLDAMEAKLTAQTDKALTEAKPHSIGDLLPEARGVVIMEVPGRG